MRDPSVFGFFGSDGLASLLVIESKPDFPTIDLRLSEPFPALKAYADSFHLSSLECHPLLASSLPLLH